MPVPKKKAPRRPALSAGIIPVRIGPEGPRYLLLRVYNYWDFPKGIVDRGEDPLDGARRELAEETAIGDVDFPWGEDCRETPPYSYGKVARYYVGRVRSEEVRLLVNPALRRAEHHGFRWVSYEEARELVSDRVKPILDWADRLVRGGRAR